MRFHRSAFFSAVILMLVAIKQRLLRLRLSVNTQQPKPEDFKLVDLDHFPENDGIYFFETNRMRPWFDLFHYCAFESAARMNPHLPVYVVVTHENEIIRKGSIKRLICSKQHIVKAIVKIMASAHKTNQINEPKEACLQQFKR